MWYDPAATGFASLATICACRVARRVRTTSRPATTVLGNSFSVNYFFLFSFLAQSERVSVGADCAFNDLQISPSRWQDLCLVVWSSCNRVCQSCNDLRLSCCVSITNDKSAINNSLWEFFFGKLFFPFLFSLTERTSFGCCGLRVERHADQPKQVARHVPCGMVQLPPGYQTCNDQRMLCCASIANDEFGQQQQSLGILFG